ncbi:MAG: hypothetical protein COB02_14920 [Candidatus Cloacimonadota bacterium]|nr:MAG: hypothetical protein COB02_14920 [Candidatus Cloacimonadota bacterium]
MSSNQKCSKCNQAIDTDSKFCGSCGFKLENNTSKVAEDLFSIEKKSSTDEETDWDEFLDSQESPPIEDHSNDDFFNIDESFEEEEELSEETPPVEPQDTTPIEKKIFTDEEDPNVIDKVDRKQKKIDEKTLKKIKKKQALQIKAKESNLSFLFFGLLGIITTFPFLIFLAIDLIPKESLNIIPLKSLKVYSHPIFMAPVLLPSFFRIILNSKIIIKIKGKKQFTQYFSFVTGAFLIFLCSIIGQFLSKSPKENLLLSFELNNALFQLDYFYLSVISFLFFTQIIIHFFFLKKIPSIFKLFTTVSFIICNLQLYAYLAIPSKQTLLQSTSNIIGHKLSYYLGELHIYIMPNYLLSQILLPFLILIFIIYSIKDLLAKDLTSSFIAFYSFIVCITAFLFLNYSYLNQNIFSLSPFLQNIFNLILKTV